MGLEKLDKDRAGDKNSSNHTARYRITRTATKPRIFITEGDFRTLMLEKLFLCLIKNSPSYSYSLFFPPFVNDPNRAQVYSQA